jgi:hypothetical protein
MMQAVKFTPTVFYFRVEDAWRWYSGGIFSTPCVNNSINHGASALHLLLTADWGSGGQAGALGLQPGLALRRCMLLGRWL